MSFPLLVYAWCEQVIVQGWFFDGCETYGVYWRRCSEPRQSISSTRTQARYALAAPRSEARLLRNQILARLVGAKYISPAALADALSHQFQFASSC